MLHLIIDNQSIKYEKFELVKFATDRSCSAITIFKLEVLTFQFIKLKSVLLFHFIWSQEAGMKAFKNNKLTRLFKSVKVPLDSLMSISKMNSIDI